MELIKWEEKLSVGNIVLDNQHKKLVSLINELHTAMREGRGREALHKILDDLVSYTREHFKTEEMMMQKAKYAALPSHKLEHEKLTKKAVSLQDAYKSEQKVVTVDVLNFLRDWLINHINGSDKKYKGVL